MTEDERKLKNNARRKAWHKNNKERAMAYAKAYRIANRKQLREYQDGYRKTNRKRLVAEKEQWAKENRELIYKRKAERRDMLTDSYIREILSLRSPLSAKDIPQELIEVKRSQLKLLRLTKEQCNV